MSHKSDILSKITSSKETVGIIGLGYVGLPLAASFVQAGIHVIGFDKSEEKINELRLNLTTDIQLENATSIFENDKLQTTSDFSKISECDAILICVPTPLDIFKKPDMSYIREACKNVGRFMKPGTFVCLESTTYPTTTEDFILPILEEQSGLKHGEGFWLAYSPERIDPGNQEFTTRNTPKVLGALTEDGLVIGKAIYQKAIDEIHPVSSPRVAEMVKILENTYRLVNISLINEMALLCGKMDIDIWEVINAASTKPYGFQAFYPGPGVGGHCIPLDPFYLEHIAKKFDFDLSMINTAGHINNLMAHRMTIKITSALNRHKKAINGSKICFLGVSYKANTNDHRESPAIKIMSEVLKKGGNIFYHDPYVASLILDQSTAYSSSTLDRELLESMDCVVITTNHDCFDPEFILTHAPLIVDLRNTIKEPSEKVYKL